MESVDRSDIIQSDPVFTEQPPVNDEYPAADDVGERQAAEEIGKQLDHLLATLALDLAVEAVYLVHAPALVVTACQIDTCASVVG